MSNTSPAYLWYPKDALASGRIDDLTATEECWYRRALDRAWDDDGISADPVKAAKRIGKKCTPKAAAKLLAEFFIPKKKDPAKMVNPRQEIERKKYNERWRKKSDAGKESGRKRRQKNDLNPEHRSNGVRTELKSVFEQSNPIPIPNLKEEKKEERNGAETAPTAQPLRSPKQTATRIPNRFPITPEMWQWLVEELPDLRDPKGAHANWVEHWTNQSGPKAEKLDWMLAWQKGMRLAKKWQDEDKLNGNSSKRSGPDRRTDAEILADSARQITG